MSKTRGATIVNKEACQESSPGKQLLSTTMSRKLGLKEVSTPQCMIQEKEI